MNRTSTLAILLALLPGVPARAQLKPGAQPPAMETSAWFNHDKVSFESLKGRVVAYAFIRMDNTDCLYFLEMWQELRHRFAFDPVTFVAITNEAPKVVKETIEVEDIFVPVVINPTDSAARDFDVQHFPSVFVQDARGKISYAGMPGQKARIIDAISEALRFARPFPPAPKRARNVTQALQKWDLARAVQAIDRELARKGIVARDRQRLGDIKALIAALGAKLAAAADHAIEDEDWPDAVTALTRLIQEHSGLPGSEGAGDKLAALKARTDIKKEIASSLQFARGERYERERNWKSAYRTFQSLAKQFPHTKAGRRAGGLAEFLKNRAK